MRAIILSAGQGRRLLPLTESKPKCLLEVHQGSSLLERQLQTLAACGVDQASVIVGFGAEQVEDHLAGLRVPGLDVRAVFNPFYGVSDNLATAWVARPEMDRDFILLNGDTLFEPAVLHRLLAAPRAPLTLCIDVKDEYDDDDMKVSLEPCRQLAAVAKTLPPETVDGESIGLMLFRGPGVAAFRSALEGAMREPRALQLWYLSVVNGLTDSLEIATSDISGLWWGEVDSAEDLEAVRKALARLEVPVGSPGPSAPLCAG